MAHTYVCESCGAQRVCAIAGCVKDCAPICSPCLKKKPAAWRRLEDHVRKEKKETR